MQTSAVAKVGDVVEVTLNRRNEDSIVLNAQVAWQRKVPSQLRSLGEGGMGLQIQYAPEHYYVLLAEAAQSSPKTRGSSI